MNSADLLARITTDPAVFGGKPVVRGERITVEQITRWFAGGASEADLLAEFPFLDHDDVRAALLYAGRVASMTRLSGEAVARLEDAAAG